MTDDAGPLGGPVVAALADRYADRPAVLLGSEELSGLGGPGPLEAVFVFRHGTPRDHWHYVSQGFSRQGDEPTGLDFELTLRLPAGDAEEPPPLWPPATLQGLGRYVFGTGNAFAAGHHVDLGVPVAPGVGTRLQVLLLGRDPELAPAGDATGVDFLQVVGITPDELQACQAWNAEGVLELLAEVDPLLLTDVGRRSRLEDPALSARVAEGAAREGSSQGLLHLQTLDWAVEGDAVEVRLGAPAAGDLSRLLPGRIPHGEPLLLAAADRLVLFEPAEAPGWRVEEADGPRRLVVSLTPGLARRLAWALEPVRGQHTWPELPGLTLTVEPTQTTGPDGGVRIFG